MNVNDVNFKDILDTYYYGTNACKIEVLDLDKRVLRFWMKSRAENVSSEFQKDGFPKLKLIWPDDFAEQICVIEDFIRFCSVLEVATKIGYVKYDVIICFLPDLKDKLIKILSRSDCKPNQAHLLMERLISNNKSNKTAFLLGEDLCRSREALCVLFAKFVSLDRFFLSKIKNGKFLRLFDETAKISVEDREKDLDRLSGLLSSPSDLKPFLLGEFKGLKLEELFDEYISFLQYCSELMFFLDAKRYFDLEGFDVVGIKKTYISHLLEKGDKRCDALGCFVWELGEKYSVQYFDFTDFAKSILECYEFIFQNKYLMQWLESSVEHLMHSVNDTDKFLAEFFKNCIYGFYNIFTMSNLLCEPTRTTSANAITKVGDRYVLNVDVGGVVENLSPLLNHIVKLRPEWFKASYIDVSVVDEYLKRNKR